MPTKTKTSAVECRGLLARVSRYRRLPVLLASLVLAGVLSTASLSSAMADEPVPSPACSISLDDDEPCSEPPLLEDPSPSPSGGESPGSSEEPSPSATAPDGWTRDDIDAVLTGVVSVAFMASLATLAALGR